MSILIKGMETPTSCDKCRFCVNGFTDAAPMYECAVQSYENVSVLVESDGQPFDFRPDWCPLVEIPTPHGRLVDATFEENHYGSMLLDPTPDVTKEDKRNARVIIDALRMARTVIEAEGRDT